MAEPVRRELDFDPVSDQQRLVDVLDGVPVGLAFYDVRGELRHRNRVLCSMLEQQRDHPAVEQEIERLIGEVCSEIALCQGSNRIILSIAEHAIRLPQKRYRVRVGYTPMHLFGPEGSVIVSVDDEREKEVADDVLERRFDLTRQEIRVARLLVDGCNNAEVARRLHISPHTARRHTEKILDKLGVSSRAKVAPLFRRLAEPAFSAED